MQWLNRISITWWFIITFVFVYATWNPTGYSLFEYVVFSHEPYSSRFVVGALVVAVGSLYLHETHQTFNKIGLIIFACIVGAALWKAIDSGILSTTNSSVWQWITPAIVAFLLTVGLQGGRIYRNATGRVPVSVDHTTDAIDHHHS